MEAPPTHAFKYTGFQHDPNSTHSKVVALVPPESRVLEFGCATGYMSEVLADKLSCTVIGIELDPEAAEVAKEHCERVIVGDAEKIDYAAELAGEEFDVVLFADVLEHLKEPRDVLRRVRPFLAENGLVIASIPNIAHGSVRLALLGGEFRYRELGLLDDTHLRFFTRDSIQDLFEETGYAITHWVRQRLDVGETEIKVPTVPDAVREWLAADPETTTYQFVVRAMLSDPNSQLITLRAELGKARAELEELRPIRDVPQQLSQQLSAARGELGELRPVVSSLRETIAQQELDIENLRAELEALRRAHEVRGRRLVAERVAFAEGLAHIQASVYGSKSWRLTAPLRAFAGLGRRLRG